MLSWEGCPWPPSCSIGQSQLVINDLTPQQQLNKKQHTHNSTAHTPQSLVIFLCAIHFHFLWVIHFCRIHCHLHFVWVIHFLCCHFWHLSFLKELQHGGLTCFLLKFFHHFNVAEEGVHHPSCYCAASFSIGIIVFYHGESLVYFPQCFTQDFTREHPPSFSLVSCCC